MKETLAAYGGVRGYAKKRAIADIFMYADEVWRTQHRAPTIAALSDFASKRTMRQLFHQPERSIAGLIRRSR
jgi:hypothetical protein